MRLMEKKARMGIWIFWGIIFWGFSVFAGSVPDTGLTTCYDEDGNVITCPSPGQNFYGQDANYTIKPLSYTKLDGNGNALPASAASWVMVRDNVTGLIWAVKTDDGSIHDRLNTYTWYDPDPATNGGNAGTPGEGTDTDDFINALNSAGFGGYSDWRVSTRQELNSICDYGRSGPAIKTEYFPNLSGLTETYWTSTTWAYSIESAWNIYFSSCGISWSPKYNYLRVRAVRGGP